MSLYELDVSAYNSNSDNTDVDSNTDDDSNTEDHHATTDEGE